jgi:hypothetical protein
MAKRSGSPRTRRSRRKDESATYLDPRLLLFKFNLNTVCNFEAIAGKNIANLDLKSSQDFRTLLLAGIMDEAKDPPTLAELGRMVDPANYKQVQDLVAESMRTAPGPVASELKGQG